MKNLTSLKRILALLLAAVMILSMAACGAPAKDTDVPETTGAPEITGSDDALSREQLEAIVEVVGDGENTDDLSDEELEQLVEELVSEMDDEQSSGVVNLGNTEKEKLPVLDMSENQGAYDENGAMKEPFDQVYPEVVERGEVKFSGESILIKLKSDKLTDGLKAAGVGALEQIVPMEGEAWYEAKLTEGTDTKAALEAVRELKEVLLAEYNYEIKTAAIDHWKEFDDKHKEDFDKNHHHKHQWHHHHCGIPDGYEEMETEGGLPSVVVAVIDTGVDYNHEDLKDNMWVNSGEIPDNGIDDDKNGYIDDYYGIDLVAGKGSADDDNGHGTHVAGIIAARNNNTGVLGIAYNTKIMSIKAATHNGTLLQSDIAKAVLYAYEMGAEVINMSFGGSASSIAVQDALSTAYTRCVLVASAGNSGYPNEGADYQAALPNYPAALTYVLGVMSVDENGTESLYTNWDTTAFNGVEYELYAPGENIMSTLPGNRYGYLSGTSMAAPVVSAIAAILRSEFSDRDMYPTKFIYGQLCSTSGYYAECVDPEKHQVNGEPHNLPQITNLYDALTKLPTPEVGMQDYAIFDSTDLSDKNNGDGVIDAGETIALGLTLRNRWGMSTNTKVTLDTLENGISDPYVTIQNPTVDYGEVGTYSTKDAGAIYTDELLTGWENPFILKIAEDIPNDYRMTFHVTIKCENALDAEDTTVYAETADIDLTARNGVILPSIIEEDMVLTANNLYIIPNATVIQAGVTVRAEPGAHIQFWSDDPKDPYASDYMAYLVVNGTFLAKGTKENPVYIYPSELMDSYCVDMGASYTGYVLLEYADVTNLNTSRTIDRAEHCTFRVNHTGSMYYRYLSGDKIYSSSRYNYTLANMTTAQDCVFYKIGSGTVSLNGNAERCIYVQGSVKVSGSQQDCVFLNVDSSFNVSGAMSTPDASKLTVYYREETGTTYVAAYNTTINQDILELLDGSYMVAQTPQEWEWLKVNVMKPGNRDSCAGLYYDPSKEMFVWSDGSEIAGFVDPDGLAKTASKKQLFFDYTGTMENGYASYPNYIYEIPGEVYLTEITSAKYQILMDMESTYQIAPQSKPAQLAIGDYIYESKDENVLTVDKNGLITPVALGTADVYIYSKDRAVFNYITVTVKDYVPLESICFAQSALELPVDETVNVGCVLTPADTTRTNVAYASDNEAVVTVDNAGNITALSSGTAVITATCEGMTAEMTVTAFNKATSLAFTNNYEDWYLEKGKEVELPELQITNGADTILVWTSSNTDVAEISGDKILLKKTGGTTLTVTDLRSGLSDTVSVSVRATAPVLSKQVTAVQLSEGSAQLPQVQMAEGIDAEPQWASSDTSVATVENGVLVLMKAGSTTLFAIDPRNGLYDSCELYVLGTETIPKVVYTDGNDFYLVDNGDLYAPDYPGTKVVRSGVQAFRTYYDGYNETYAMLLLEDGTVELWNAYDLRYAQNGSAMETWTDLVGRDVAGIAFSVQEYTDDPQYSGETMKYSCYAYLTDGTAYAWGTGNDYAQLGTGDRYEQSSPYQLSIGNVTDIEVSGTVAYFLTSDGGYACVGGRETKDSDINYAHINSGFIDLCDVDAESENAVVVCGDYDVWLLDGLDGGYDSYSSYNNTTLDMSVYDSYSIAIVDGSAGGVGIIDGVVYTSILSRSEYRHPLKGVYDAAAVLMRDDSSYYVITDEGFLLSAWYSDNVNYVPVVTPFQEKLELIDTNLTEDNVLLEDTLVLTFNKQSNGCGGTLYADGVSVSCRRYIGIPNQLLISLWDGSFMPGVEYKLEMTFYAPNNIESTERLTITFTYGGEVVQEPEESTETEATEEAPAEEEETTAPSEVVEPLIRQSQTDETVERFYYTSENLAAELADILQTRQINSKFYGNAVLNPIATNTNTDTWFRVWAESVSAGTYKEVPLGGNYWGTTNETAIGLQMVDYSDYITYARLMYAPYLTEAPENTFPFVTSVKLINKYGEEVTTAGNEEITFRVSFNRDMDTSIPLQVRFGSAAPYGDYQIDGAYVDARTWEGTYTLKTTIENGSQYFSISNGCSATDDLELQPDQKRFTFKIDTMAAQALIMQGTATDTGIQLSWTQDDFDTLMGYNVYRSTSEDGYYRRLNATVIPADTMEWFDDTVEPGKVYYYNFTVVQTDLTESVPSGKIVIMSKDTMAPNIYHTPVYSAVSNQNLIISAEVTDNLTIAYANLYYRAVGAESWTTVRMNALNDKYSAIIPATDLSMDGMEYYIEAFDGVSYTYRGSAEAPFAVTVKEALDVNSLGDVDGDGVVTNRDALILLQAISDKYNMTEEEFARADLNQDQVLSAVEALRILHYVSGKVGSLDMTE